jgi:hypothetical protein
MNKRRMMLATAVILSSIAIGQLIGGEMAKRLRRSTARRNTATVSSPAVPTRSGPKTGTSPGIQAMVVQGGSAESHYHLALVFNEQNSADPGWLVIKGKVTIGNPLDADHPDVAHVIEVTITDMATRNVAIDHDPIGKFTDQAAVGHWQQEFSANYQLPPGKYFVEVMTHDATRPRTKYEVGAGHPMFVR